MKKLTPKQCWDLSEASRLKHRKTCPECFYCEADHRQWKDLDKHWQERIRLATDAINAFYEKQFPNL